VDPLAQLKDIHTPQGVDWWPLAWGWWVAALLVVVLLCGLIYMVIRHIRFNQARREAIALHKDLSVDAHYPAKANQLLKRVTLHYFDAGYSAAAYGSAWQHLLLNCLADKHQVKAKSGLEALCQSPYQPTVPDSEQLTEMHQAVSLWLQKARLKQAPQPVSTAEVSHNV